MIGLDAAIFSDSKSDYAYKTYKADYTASLGYILFSAGGDLYLSFRFSQHFGLFADCAARYLIAGASFGDTVYKYKDGGSTHTESNASIKGDLLGKFRIQPSLGVVWTF